MARDCPFPFFYITKNICQNQLKIKKFPISPEIREKFSLYFSMLIFSDFWEGIFPAKRFQHQKKISKASHFEPSLTIKNWDGLNCSSLSRVTNDFKPVAERLGFICAARFRLINPPFPDVPLAHQK
jgi:hypothetical protein